MVHEWWYTYILDGSKPVCVIYEGNRQLKILCEAVDSSENNGLVTAFSWFETILAFLPQRCRPTHSVNQTIYPVAI